MLYCLLQVLSACLQSVAAAAATISAHPAKQPADGQLFEIKHLLILREQIAPFQVDFKVKETSLNFGQIKSAAVSLINNRFGRHQSQLFQATLGQVGHPGPERE